MAFNFSTKQKTGQTLKARFFNGSTQVITEVALTEMGTTGYYYASNILFTALGSQLLTILVHDGTDYLDTISEVRIVNDLAYEDWMAAQITTIDTLMALVGPALTDILADTNELQSNQDNWVTDETSLVASIRADLERTGGLANVIDGKVDALVAPDNTSILEIKALAEDLIKYHNNKVVFFGADGTTQVVQADAYFMTIYDNDNTTVLKRIEFKDATDTASKLSDATNYIKT